MKKGSITIYLSLVLCVCLALITGCIDSVRLANGRAAVSCAADEGLFSLFGEYDRTLYKKYGLLFIDGGYGGSTLKAGELMQEAKETTEDVLGVSGLSGRSAASLYRASIDSGAVTGYVLATDSGYEELKMQISDLMTKKLGANGISEITALITGNSSLLSSAESGQSDNIDSLKSAYDNAKSEAEARQAEAEENGETVEAVEVPDDFVNPIDNASRIRSLGMFANVVPNIGSISNASVDLSSLPHSRSLTTGMGLLPKTSSSIADKLLIAEYAAEFFPNYRDPGTQDGLKYQVEYAVAGKSTDVENLKAVLNRIFIVREAANFAFLNFSEAYKAQADETALIICTAIFLPELAPIVSELIIALWSWNESLNDVKILLSGGKVPIMKNESSWNLQLTDLATYSSGTIINRSSSGLAYLDYLRIFLYLKSEDDLIESTADLIEYNRRITDSEPQFSIDCCVAALEIELDGSIGTHDYCLSRSYGYDANVS